MLYFNCTLYHSTSVFEILNWLLIIFMINTLAFQYSIQSSLFTFQLQVSPIPPWVIVYASIKSNCFLFSIIQHAVLHLCKFIPVFSQWRPALFQVINFYEFFMTQIRHLYEASPNQLLSYVCVCVCVCAQLLSHVRHFMTPWTAAFKAPLSMGILQARILEWVAMGDCPNTEIEPRSPTLQADYPLRHQGNPRILEWVAYTFSRGTCWLEGIKQLSPALQADSLQAELTRKASFLPQSHKIFFNPLEFQLFGRIIPAFPA